MQGKKLINKRPKKNSRITHYKSNVSDGCRTKLTYGRRSEKKICMVMACRFKNGSVPVKVRGKSKLVVLLVAFGTRLTPSLIVNHVSSPFHLQS